MALSVFCHIKKHTLMISTTHTHSLIHLRLAVSKILRFFSYTTLFFHVKLTLKNLRFPALATKMFSSALELILPLTRFIAAHSHRQRVKIYNNNSMGLKNHEESNL